MRGISTRRSTAARGDHGEPHQGGASSTCSPTAPRRRPCRPTSSGSGSPPWPTCCCADCAVSAWRTPSSPRPPCGTIRLKLLKLGALVAASACGGSRSRWRPACPWQDEFGIGPCPTAQRRRLTRNQTEHRHHAVPPDAAEFAAGAELARNSDFSGGNARRCQYLVRDRNVYRETTRQYEKCGLAR